MEVFGDDLSYNPLNVWNQAASSQHNFVTVTDLHTKTVKTWDTGLVQGGFFCIFPPIEQKCTTEQHESFAINAENSFPLLSFHSATFLLISSVYSLFVNGMFSALYTRTLKGILAHCFCPKCAHSLPPS